MPIVVKSAAVMSLIDVPTRTGARSSSEAGGSPVMLMMPPIP